MPAGDGMVVRTNTQRVRLARKTNVELILSQHVDHCVTCVRSGNCSLQALSKAMNIQEVPFRNEATERPWDKTLPILRDSSKCIKCLRCVSVCERVQSLGVWEVTGSGAHTHQGRPAHERGQLRPLRPVREPLPRGRPAGAGRHRACLRGPL